MLRKFLLGVLVLSVSAGLVFFSSCKSCNKEKEASADIVTPDTTTVAPAPTIMAEHGDTSLIPVLSKVLDEAFAASSKKDYVAFGSYIVYRGPDSTRHGVDVFTAKTKYEKTILRITSETFNKWNKDVDELQYARVFELPQPDGRRMPVLEVMFVSDKKKLERKFFGFLQLGNDYKIADVTSWL